MAWNTCYKQLLPHVFAIETPGGSGTGFILALNDSKTLAGIATAAHVVEHANIWKEPIKVRHHVTGDELFLPHDERVIFIDQARDSATILFMAATLTAPPPEALEMIPSKNRLAVGTEVGWIGFPWIVSPHVCFFSGCISAWDSNSDSYLIDGVAINGVSGGPVFVDMGQAPRLVGTVSAYISNRLGNQTLPGLLRAHDLTSAQATVQKFRDLTDARNEEQPTPSAPAPEPPPSDIVSRAAGHPAAGGLTPRNT